jgi:hypothetical protein
MLILSIDPGPILSAFIIYDTETKTPFIDQAGICVNELMVKFVRAYAEGSTSILSVEMVASYGQRVGQTVFETCVWIGRFIQAWEETSGKRWIKVYRRKDVFAHLCPEGKPNDGAVSIAIANRYGGNVKTAKGTKKNPGPLYGLKGDMFSALAVAITTAEVLLNPKNGSCIADSGV